MREDGFGGEQAGSVLGGMRLRTHRKRENIHRVRMRCQLGLSRCKFHLNSINLLPPANEVWGKVMFLHMSVILSTGWRGSLYDVTSCPMFLLRGLCLWPHVTSGGSLSREGLCPGGLPDRDPPYRRAGGAHLTGMHSCFEILPTTSPADSTTEYNILLK